MTILPSLILVFDKAIEKTKHRVIMPDIGRISGWVTRHSAIFVVLFLVVLVPAIYGYTHTSVYYDLAGTLPDNIREIFVNGDYQMMIVSSEYAIASDEVNAQIDAIQEIIKRYDDTAMLIGEAPCTKDLIEITDSDSALSDLVSIKTNDKEIGKEESAYLLTDATGTVHDTIVSEHLINSDESATITDASTLSDIKNVKGDETFSQDGETLTWQAGGNDIFPRRYDRRTLRCEQRVKVRVEGTRGRRERQREIHLQDGCHQSGGRINAVPGIM